MIDVADVEVNGPILLPGYGVAGYGSLKELTHLVPFREGQLSCCLL